MTIDHHRPSPPNPFYIFPLTTPDTQLSHSTSMSSTSAASPPGMEESGGLHCSYLSVSSSPGVPKYEHAPVLSSHSRTTTMT
ncbi:hypothetical protein P692DRAFT_20828273 [Suillus brevipes Sb2]|nr:hypothetical protein P692DRAFT_20828273 [Suillus brevipes Sb2]